MNPPPPNPPGRPLVPRLIVTGFAWLFLSWLVFTGYFVLKWTRRPPSSEAPPRVLPNTNTAQSAWHKSAIEARGAKSEDGNPSSGIRHP